MKTGSGSLRDSPAHVWRSVVARIAGESSSACAQGGADPRGTSSAPFGTQRATAGRWKEGSVRTALNGRTKKKQCHSIPPSR